MAHTLPTTTTITFTVTNAYQRLTCDCQTVATLDVYENGEFLCVACPTCIVTIPGYYKSMQPEEITNVWNVIRTKNGKPVMENDKAKVIGQVYGMTMVDARENAAAIVGSNAGAFDGFMVRRLYAKDIARMVHIPAAPDYIETTPEPVHGHSNYDTVTVAGPVDGSVYQEFTVIGTDDMRDVARTFRQPVAPAKPLDQTDDMREIVRKAKDEANRVGRTVEGVIISEETADGKPVTFGIKFSH
jgi:hypothetical protein